MLEDIAVITGGKLISKEAGLKLESVTQDMLGQARKVVSTKENTTVIEGKGRKEDMNARIAQIKTEIKTTESDFDKEKLQKRLEKLT